MLYVKGKLMNSSGKIDIESFDQTSFKTFFDKLNLAVYVMDFINNEIIFVNEFVQKKYPNILRKKCYEQFSPTQNGPCDGCINDKVLKREYSNTREHFNQSEKKWLYNTEQVINWNGTVAILEISQDVTELKSAQVKSPDSELLLKTVINELPNPFVLKNYEGKFLLANKAVATLYGVENPDDMIGKDDGDYIPDKEQAAFFKRNVQEIMDGGETKVVFEDSIDVETGNRRNYMSIKKPYKNQHNKSEILVITNDITDIRKAEQTLLQYEKIISVSSDFLSYQDKNGIYQAVNDTYLNAFELKREEIIGKHQKDLLGEDHYNKNILPKFKRALTGEKVFYEDWTTFPGIGKRYVRVNYHSYTPKGSNEIEGIVVQVNDLTDRKNAEEKFIYLAHHDTLTGLANRRKFSDKLTSAIPRAKRNSNKLAVLFIDLDRFKAINDSLGHTMGDEVLKKVSTLFKKNIREVDTIARSGGDEFLILIEDVKDLKFVITICQNIINILQQPMYINKHELFISSSIGVSIYPDDAINEESLIQNADTAMYQAKRNGRNNYQIANVIKI